MLNLPRQFRQTRLPAPGPHPDWSEVEWHVYHSPRGYRVAAQPIPQGSKRRSEQYVGTVKRCSLRTVRKLLADGVPARQIQAKVDTFADAQAIRTAPQPNTYRDLCAKIERESRAMNDQRRAA